MPDIRKCILLFSLIGFLAGLVSCSSEDDTETTDIFPALVYGDISFTDISPATLSRLTINPVVSYTSQASGILPVRLYDVANNNLAVAGSYMPVNNAVDSSTYVAANYQTNPNVLETGSDFLLHVDAIRFEDGASYRFGSLLEYSPSSQACLGVTPESVAPAGTQCDISECPALLDLQYRFVGEPEDLAALLNQPVSCVITAKIQDPPTSSSLTIQAQSGELISALDEISGDGVAAKLLVRATTSPIMLNISCRAQVAANETGFVIEQETGLTPFNTEISIPALNCGAVGPEPVAGEPPMIDIEVTRDAGVLQGHIDVSDHNEVSAKISLDKVSSVFSIDDPPLTSIGEPLADKWVFEGVPAGSHSVIAQAIVDEGDKLVMFPHRDGLNSTVEIQTFETTDINTTFVAKPTRAHGTVRLKDPEGNTDLHALVNPPFSSYMIAGNSYIEARGKNELLSEVTNPGSGIGGISRSRLLGSYNTATNEALMNYELLLLGISPEDGPPTGLGAKATLWEVDKLAVRVEQAAFNNSRVDVQLGTYLPAPYDLEGEQNKPIAEQQMCFGKGTLQMKVAPEFASLYSPYLQFFSTGGHEPTMAGTSPLASVPNGSAYGLPSGIDNALPSVEVSATMPEGFKYVFMPQVRLLPANQSNYSLLNLSSLTLPYDRVLGCSESFDACLTVTDEEGNYEVLTVNVMDEAGKAPKFCVKQTELDLKVRAHASGGTVTQLGYVFDPPDDADADDVCLGDIQVLCTNCGPHPEYALNTSSLSLGNHTVVACATDAFNCASNDKYEFDVIAEFALACPADFTVQLNPGETEIANSDPRIADNLQASIVGGCDEPPPITNDQPDNFSLGETTVNFSAEGFDSCNTKVKLQPATIHELAFVERQSTTVHTLKSYQIELDSMLTHDTFAGGEPDDTWVEYDYLGDTLGYSYKGPNEVHSFNLEEPAEALYVATSLPVNLAYRPVHPGQYAVVTTTDYTSFNIDLIVNGNVAATQAVPSVPGMSTVEIAWAPLGDKLSAIYTAPVAANPAASTTYFYEWSATNNAFSLLKSATIEKDFKETVHELLHLADGSGRYGTHLTLNKVEDTTITETSSLLVPNQAGTYDTLMTMDDLDFTDDGSTAAMLYKINDQTFGVVFILVGLNTTEPAMFPIPATFLNPREVAISSDQQYVAISTLNKIYVYNVQDKMLVSEKDINDAYDLVFRPVGPFPALLDRPPTDAIPLNRGMDVDVSPPDQPISPPLRK